MQESADLRSSLAVLIRRWPITVAGLLITAAAMANLARLAPPAYAASGTLLILPPLSGGQPPSVHPDPRSTTTAANPYLQYGKLVDIGQILATKMAGEDTALEVARRGGSGTFKIAVAPSPAPIIRLDIQADSPAQALATYQAAEAVAVAHLATMQHDQGAPEQLDVRLTPINEPLQPKRDTSDTVRVIIMLVVVGSAITVFAAFAAEGHHQHRARRCRY